MITDAFVALLYQKEFVRSIEADTVVQRRMQQDLLSLTSEIAALPRNAAPPEDGFLRREILLERIVRHVRSSIRFSDATDARHLDACDTSTVIWVLQIFRNMIESHYEFDKSVKNMAAAYMSQLMLDECGVTDLCLDLVAEGMKVTLQK